MLIVAQWYSVVSPDELFKTYCIQSPPGVLKTEPDNPWSENVLFMETYLPKFYDRSIKSHLSSGNVCDFFFQLLTLKFAALSVSIGIIPSFGSHENWGSGVLFSSSV